jgi:hypothetical protein
MYPGAGGSTGRSAAASVPPRAAADVACLQLAPHADSSNGGHNMITGIRFGETQTVRRCGVHVLASRCLATRQNGTTRPWGAHWGGARRKLRPRYIRIRWYGLGNSSGTPAVNQWCLSGPQRLRDRCCVKNGTHVRSCCCRGRRRVFGPQRLRDGCRVPRRFRWQRCAGCVAELARKIHNRAVVGVSLLRRQHGPSVSRT